MGRELTKLDIDKMLESGYSIEEIAENQGSDECVQKVLKIDFPSWCGENAECHNCWVKCLEEHVKEDSKVIETDNEWVAEVDMNTDTWLGDIWDTREEAIKNGTKQAKEEGVNCFRIGRAIPCAIPSISVDTVIEYAYEQLYDEVGEVAETYLEGVTKEQSQELEESLNEIFYEWSKKYNLLPSCYRIENEEVIEVK